jgi:hypothetical protein
VNTSGALSRVKYAAADVALTLRYYEENMGYTTDFAGRFELNKPLTEAHAAYLNAFSGTRRMKRDEGITSGRPDPLREAVGLPVGHEGAFFVGEGGDFGQGNFGWGPDGVKQKSSAGILDYNNEPATQPGLWCQWVPSDDRQGIEWNGAEKFYNYVEWMNYLIENFLAPWGYTLTGRVDFQGESSDDNGRLVIVANVCKVNPSALVELAECAGDLTDEDFDG